MRILYLALDIRLDEVSGDAIHVHEATRALTAIGASVDLVVPSIEGKRQSHEGLQKAGVRIHSITAKGDVQVALACRKIAAEVKAQVIYERRYSPKIAAAVSRATRLPFLVEVNGLPDVEIAALGRFAKGSKAVKAVKSRLRKSLYARASRVVAVTPGIATLLQARYDIPGEKVVILPNAADTEAFRPGDRTAAKKALHLPANAPVIGFVGTLYPWHGLQYLIEAAPAIVRAHPDALFLIVGDGPQRAELEARVMAARLAANFRFTGRVDHERVPEHITASDVCVSLIDAERYSEKYGFSPLKLYEYLACGCPVVATRTAGFDILETFECGALVNPRDPREVSRTILEMLHDPPALEAMGKRGRRLAEEQYSWKSVATRLLAVMKEVVG